MCKVNQSVCYLTDSLDRHWPLVKEADIQVDHRLPYRHGLGFVLLLFAAQL